MKANKKNIRNAILLTIAAIVLVVATVLTTLAYLISAASVSNTFTVGKVEIELWETPVDEHGKKLTKNGLPDGEPVDKTSDGNSYHLLPGVTYSKDPTVYINPGSSETLLFALIQNDIFNIEVPYEENGANTDGKLTMREQMKNACWLELHDFGNHLRLYVYAGTNVASATPDNFAYIIPAVSNTGGKLAIDMFTEFTINPAAKQTDINLAQGAKVTVGAFAIQDTGIDTDFISKEKAIEQWNTIVDNVEYLYDSHKITVGNTTGGTTGGEPGGETEDETTTG